MGLAAMRLRVTRDSVAATSDDMFAPHEKTFTIPDCGDPFEYVEPLVSRYGLPQIVRGEATWVVSSRPPLAVVPQQWPTPRRVQDVPPALEDLDVRNGTLVIHITHLAQQDPETVAASWRG